MLEVTINGDCRQFGRDLAVTELLDELALAGKRVAIEKNGEIVPRSRYADTRLANGDRLEIVVAVGGIAQCNVVATRAVRVLVGFPIRPNLDTDAK